MSEISQIPLQLNEAREALTSRIGDRLPEIGLVLGSGLGAASLPIDDPLEVEASEIPHLPVPSVAGHRGVWTFGSLAGRRIVVAGGRVHRYEGLSLAEATFGVRLIHTLGAHSLVVTNAAGGIREDLVPGTLMRIRDHLNFLGDSPLVGPHDDSFGARFVDMTEAYDCAWGARVAEQLGGSEGLAEGVYAACLGPQYETPSEVDYLAKVGADAVGMSTVPEVIVARQVGLAVFGLSLISNKAAGRGDGTLSHEEVIEAGRDAVGRLGSVVSALVETAPLPQ